MASVSKDDVKRLARLARLKLSDDELERFAAEFTEILNYVEQLEAVDVSELTPTYQVNGLKNVMRSDELINYGASPEELLKNAPATENHQIKVKRILD